MRAEGSLDDTNWFNMDITEGNTTKTETNVTNSPDGQGVFAMVASYVPIRYIRFRFVSGTANIAVKYGGLT